MNRFHYTQLCNTYSIIARDPDTGQLGGAVQTHQMAVGRLIPYLRAGVGAVASQSLVNLRYNALALTMLEEGIPTERIITALTASDSNATRRQVAVLNNDGDAAAFTGEGCIREFGHFVGEGYSVQANMMTNPTVIDAMRLAFEAAEGDLAHRMLAALYAAQAEDGDIRGKQSAALKVVSGDRATPEWESVYDLRVDDHATPVKELARLVTMRYAQLVDADGHQQLAQGNLDAALTTWERARNLVPSQEEPAFWQAVTLADTNLTDDALRLAADIFNTAMQHDNRREHWLDLIRRLQDNGLIQRERAGDELIQAIQEQT